MRPPRPVVGGALLALVASLAPSVHAQVSICGNWSTGTTHVAGTGSNRCLVVAVGGESSSQGANDFTGVSYGGQSLTLIDKIETSGSGISYVGSLWYLDEAGIASASNTTISVTTSGPGFDETNVAAVTYCNVDQSDPVGDFSSVESSDGSPVDPISDSITIGANHAGIAAAGCGRAGGFTWTQDVSEQTDQNNTSSAWSTADGINTGAGGTKTAEADFGPGSVNRNVLLSAEIKDAPVADFTASPTSGVAPLNVSFTDQSTGDITSYAWTFGDGGTSTSASPSHNYTSAGTYTVSLTVTGTGGSNTETKTDLITVTERAPVANFTASPTSGVSPLNVTFTDTSTGGPITTYAWTFGDGGTSSAANPMHTYNSAGTYTVSLTVTGPGGADSETKTDFITVSERAPVANFTASPTSGNYPLNVTFTDTSTGGPITTYAWTFGDGGTSSAANPMHNYTAAGTYTVSLMVTGPGGSDTNTMTDLITVTDPPPIANFTASPTSGTAPLNVTFTDTSTGGPITTYAWTFGDGGTSSATNPMHTYNASGTYTVSLMVTGPGGSDTNTMTDLIVVSDSPPIANFTASPTSGTHPLAVTFTDTSTGGPITTYAWTFGDGGTSSAANPMHTYTAAGTYTVSLMATGPGGSDTNTMTDLITVTDPAPIANFSASPTSGSHPLAVTFTDTSTGPITTYAWTFGDGGTSSAASPMHTYTAAGTYTVSLMVTGPGGSDTNTMTDLITVTEPAPIANFTASPTSGTHPLAVTFTDTSTGGPITTYAWTFGDGGTSSMASPMHTYTAAGTYTVSLMVTGPGGSDTNTMTDLITVTEPAPIANFTASPTSGTHPLAVTFTDTSTGGPITTYAWTFGDGGTSSMASPMHTYTAAGTYTVSLMVTGPGGSDTNTMTDLITVTEPAPVANFTASPTSGTHPLAVTFTDTSTGGPITTYAWTFGDGGTSSMASPMHTYNAAGTYTVSLMVTGPGGSDTNTMTDLITVTEPAPIANFTASPTSGSHPLAVTFTDTSTGGPITTYAWTFGDGGTSSMASPMHTYTAAGTYTVSLMVTGPGGSDTNTMTDLITVTDPAPVADFMAAPTAGTAPLDVTFTDTSTGPITTYAWTFGDGGTSAVASPMYTYNSPGTYTVSLMVTGPGGSDTNTMMNLITVGNTPPTADFTASPTSGTHPLAVTFTDTSTGVITSYAWTFGDGGTSTMSDPMHTYTAAGTYTVSLMATGPGGSDTNTMTDLITVTDPAPIADFSASPTSGNHPLDVTFTDASTGPITAYAWTFGDGGTSTAASPMHTYNAAGTYTVSLMVTGPGGSDTNTMTDLITVTDPAPIADFSASPTSGSHPLDVTFTDASTGPITAYAWTFGDGGTSTAASPMHTYNAAGTYTVSLMVTGPGGSDTNTMTDLITVTEPAPIANFSASPLTGASPLDVTFTDLSTGPITTYAWTFGDGGTSSAASPMHTYNAAGTYTVSLMVTGPGGSDTNTMTDLITVTGGAPVANFTGTPTSGVAPLDVSFTDTSTGTITSYAWDFGDGATSTVQDPMHTYSLTGAYTVSLTVTGPSGSDTNTMTDFIIVSGEDFQSLPDGSQVVPPVVTSGTAVGTFTLDLNTSTVTVSGTYSNLNSTQLSVSVRRGLSGNNGPSVYTLTGTGGTSGTFSGSAVLTGAQIQHMIDGEHYLLVHSTSEPFGEIRGQICRFASVSFRNGGTNPVSYTSNAPVMGGTLTGTVDLTTTGHNLALLVGYQTPLTFMLGSGQTILVNITDPGGEVLSKTVVPGPMAVFNCPVPTDLSVCSFRISTQAVHIGGVSPFALSNAQDLVTGY